MAHPHHHHAHAPPQDFTQAPMLVFWETTKACPLACAHCRAQAQATALPGELSTEQGLVFVRDLAGFGAPPPILVVTGGDPLARHDIFSLIAEAGRLGLRVALAPAVSPSLFEAADRLRELGVQAISISLDGASAETHDAIRQVPGHFDRTLEAMQMLVSKGFTVQINSTVMRKNVEELADIAGLLAKTRVHIWEVFFLIHVGRGTEIAELAPPEMEDVMHLLYDAASYGFIVRTVEAPFFRRIVRWRAESAATADVATQFGLGSLYRRLSGRLQSILGPPTTTPRAQTMGTRDGNGIIFVAHDGSICPAGFLPLELGNVRTQNIVDLYRNHATLKAIRAAAFGGRCGRCEFAALCGGSRSRAFAASGDPLGEDPACPYAPPPPR